MILGMVFLHSSSNISNMEVLCQACNKNSIEDKFEKVVSFAELISRICLEGLKKLANDVLRLLQNMCLGNDEYSQHLVSLRSFKRVEDRVRKV